LEHDQDNGYILYKECLHEIEIKHQWNGRLEIEEAIQHPVPYLEAMYQIKRN